MSKKKITFSDFEKKFLINNNENIEPSNETSSELDSSHFNFKIEDDKKFLLAQDCGDSCSGSDSCSGGDADNCDAGDSGAPPSCKSCGGDFG